MAAPTITSVAPTSIPTSGGYTTITGTDFSTTPANNTVTVNKVPCVVDSASATTLVVRVPQTAVAQNSGLASITVTNSNGSVTDATKLTLVVIPAGSSAANFIGSFDTSGTAKLSLSGQFSGLANQYKSGSAQQIYSVYLERLAKLDAVRLYNTRYDPDLSVPTAPVYGS